MRINALDPRACIYAWKVILKIVAKLNLFMPLIKIKISLQNTNSSVILISI